MSALGIQHLYPRVPFNQKLKAYIALARPFTLIAVLLGVTTTTIMGAHTNPNGWSDVRSHTRILLDGTAALLLVQIGSNYVNQAFDAPEDRVNKPYRGIPRGIITTDEALALGHILWWVAIFRATTIGPAFGALTILLVLTSYAYSAPPLRLKRLPWFGNLSVAIARGALGIAAAWTILNPWYTPLPWITGLILTIFLLGATTAKDFTDAPGDASAGVRTLVVEYGPELAAGMSLPFTLSPLITIPLANLHGYLHTPIWAYTLLLIVTARFAWLLIQQQNTKNKILEGGKVWTWYYLTIFTIMTTLAASV